MNKNLIWILLILINITFVNSQLELIDIQPQNAVLSPGEVYQAEITLNNPVSELKKQNIKFYTSDNISKPISPFLTKLSKDYYFLYFEIPTSYEEGNYKLKIEGQSFLVNNVLEIHKKEDPIVIKKTQPSVKIIPGLILLNNDAGSFELYVESKDIQTTIDFIVPNYITHPYITEQSLNPNVQRKFTFNYNTNQVTSGEIILSYGSKSFKIPIFFQSTIEQPSKQEENNTSNIIPNKIINFLIDGTSLNKILKESESLEGNLKMLNMLNRSLKNIQISIDGNINEVITITPLNIVEIAPNIEFSVFLSINKDKDALPGTYNGNILFSEELTEKLPITVTILEEFGDIPLDLEEEIDLDIKKETEKSNNVVEELVPWNLSGEYGEETNEATKPLVALITILLVVAILIFLLSQKKTTKKKSFKKLMDESK